MRCLVWDWKNEEGYCFKLIYMAANFALHLSDHQLPDQNLLNLIPKQTGLQRSQSLLTIGVENLAQWVIHRMMQVLSADPCLNVQIKYCFFYHALGWWWYLEPSFICPVWKVGNFLVAWVSKQADGIWMSDGGPPTPAPSTCPLYFYAHTYLRRCTVFCPSRAHSRQRRSNGRNDFPGSRSGDILPLLGGDIHF